MDYTETQAYKDIEAKATELGWSVKYNCSKNTPPKDTEGQEVDTSDHHHISINSNKVNKEDNSPLIYESQFHDEDSLTRLWDKAKEKLDGWITEKA